MIGKLFNVTTTDKTEALARRKFNGVLKKTKLAEAADGKLLH